eukprot:Hpha_TRINITY_DN10444_c0_g1::TRINITY_DN10444_c0_g1_i1::g.193230::m.193230
MPEQGLTLRTRVGLALLCAGLPLLGVLSYNIGFVNSEDDTMAVIDHYNAANQMVRSRLQSCQRVKTDAADTTEVEQDLEDYYRNEERQLGIENEALHQGNEKLRAQTEACEEKSRNALEKRLENDPIDKVITLTYEKEDLETQLGELNKTKKTARNSLRERVRALRLENQQIRTNLDAWQNELDRQERLFQEWNAEQQRQAESDYGFGQAGTEEGDWWSDGYTGKDEDKEQLKNLEKGMRAGADNVYDPKKDGDEEAQWAEWDKFVEEQMANEDVDYLSWGDVLPTPAPTTK